MISKFVKLLAVALLVVSCSKKNDNLSELVINTQEGPVTYYLETALTKDQMAKGLMDRKELRADSGMIFVLQGQEDIAMWMKDTYIPLDMVFISKQGKVIAVYKTSNGSKYTMTCLCILSIVSNDAPTIVFSIGIPFALNNFDILNDLGTILLYLIDTMGAVNVSRLFQVLIADLIDCFSFSIFSHVTFPLPSIR